MSLLVAITRDMLERLGYKVITATDSPGALRLFLDDPSRFDLVITDQVMPEMTGMNLAEQILKVRPTSRFFSARDTARWFRQRRQKRPVYESS